MHYQQAATADYGGMVTLALLPVPPIGVAFDPYPYRRLGSCPAHPDNRHRLGPVERSAQRMQYVRKCPCGVAVWLATVESLY